MLYLIKQWSVYATILLYCFNLNQSLKIDDMLIWHFCLPFSFSRSWPGCPLCSLVFLLQWKPSQSGTFPGKEHMEGHSWSMHVTEGEMWLKRSTFVKNKKKSSKNKLTFLEPPLGFWIDPLMTRVSATCRSQFLSRKRIKENLLPFGKISVHQNVYHCCFLIIKQVLTGSTIFHKGAKDLKYPILWFSFFALSFLDQQKITFIQNDLYQKKTFLRRYQYIVEKTCLNLRKSYVWHTAVLNDFWEKV